MEYKIINYLKDNNKHIYTIQLLSDGVHEDIKIGWFIRYLRYYFNGRYDVDYTKDTNDMLNVILCEV